MLREGGADVTLRLEDAGHQLVFDEIAAAKNWLQESSRE
jgi:predicted esterase